MIIFHEIRLWLHWWGNTLNYLGLDPAQFSFRWIPLNDTVFEKQFCVRSTALGGEEKRGRTVGCFADRCYQPPVFLTSIKATGKVLSSLPPQDSVGV